MKKIVFVFLLLQLVVNAQFVGTPYIIPVDSRPVLDQVGASPSFAFSTRKLREGYTGFAVRLRRATDNSQIDVAFDDNGIVSDNSIVTLAVVGTSGASLGQTTTLSIYKGTNPLYVTIWYDQGTNGYNGVQNTVAKQAIFSMASAGATNQYASLLFSGATAGQNVIVNQTMQTLLGNVTANMGLRGSVCMIAKITANTNNFTFGYDTGSIRWSGHMNWSDANCYVDLGNSNDINRSFVNGPRLNLYKNYLFIRGNNYKKMRASGTILNSAAEGQNLNTGIFGGSFGVGFAITTNSLIGFSGNIPEFILYPEPLTVAQYSLMENNQISFWGAN